jgi:hypothetical protein
MKAKLGSKPVLWFLFLFNLIVAISASLIVDGSQGIIAGVVMGVISLGAGSALFRQRRARLA